MNHKDLDVWKKSMDLVEAIYMLTQKFPDAEKFGLTSQMRRAAVSITSNIVEGFSRRGLKEKIQFYAVSSGSLTELQNQVIVSKDICYLQGKSLQNIQNQLTIVQKFINGLIKSAKKVHYA